MPSACEPPGALLYTARHDDPQNPAVRRKQKARRSKQLAEWRVKNEGKKDTKAAAPPAAAKTKKKS